jgi:stalled ribosome rescue protein Dom34
MKQSTVWIDHHKAYIFDYQADGIHERILESHNYHEKVTKEELKKFYHDVAHNLNNRESILVLGPGQAKEEFKNYCEEHSHLVNKAIVKVESMKDHPSTEQILKISNVFFKQQFSWKGH